MRLSVCNLVVLMREGIAKMVLFLEFVYFYSFSSLSAQLFYVRIFFKLLRVF